jgi:hypothetical protein
MTILEMTAMSIPMMMTTMVSLAATTLHSTIMIPTIQLLVAASPPLIV